MRQIKFRGKPIEGKWYSGEMVEGDLMGCHIHTQTSSQDEWWGYEVDEETIEVQTDSGEWKSVNDIKII